jgi:N-acetylglucosamine malate deacetylase 1
MRILVIAPHPDDEVIGCGGTLCVHSKQGDRIAAVFLTSGELGLEQLPPAKARAIREREARAAGKVLGLADLFFLRQRDWFVGDGIRQGAAALRPILRRIKPRLIFLPHPREWHPDHQAAYPMVLAALARAQIPPPELRAYEVWTPLGEYDHVQDISRVMTRKLRALRAHRSQLGEFNYLQAVSGLNQFRGAMAGKCRYAEVFRSLDSKSGP